jgi:hypothetical protein
LIILNNRIARLRKTKRIIFVWCTSIFILIYFFELSSNKTFQIPFILFCAWSFHFNERFSDFISEYSTYLQVSLEPHPNPPMFVFTHQAEHSPSLMFNKLFCLIFKSKTIFNKIINLQKSEIVKSKIEILILFIFSIYSVLT